MSFSSNMFEGFNNFRRFLFDAKRDQIKRERTKTSGERGSAPKPSALRLENLEERVLLSVAPLVEPSVAKSFSCIESSYVAAVLLIPDLSAAFGLDEQPAITVSAAPMATFGTYDAHDLEAIQNLGLTATSEGVVWNPEGRLVELTYVNLSITSITLTDCTALTKLDVSGCTSLTTLNCYNNALTSLDLSDCANLETLYCYQNELTSLDLSNCPNLETLICSYNPIILLDVSKCGKLELIDCGMTSALTSLNLSGCANLTTIWCPSSALTSLDLSGCVNLTGLQCRDNALTSIDVSDCVKLRQFYCYGNALSSLDVSSCEALQQLFCDSNGITTLDLSNNPNLTSLRFSSNVESVLLTDDEDVSLQVVPSTSWNALAVFDGNDEALDAIQNDSIWNFTVESNAKVPIFANYLLDGEQVGQTTINIKPDAPKLTLVSSTGNDITIDVGAVEGATEYVVEYGTDSSLVNYETLALVDAGEVILSNLASATLYHMRVKAIRGGTESDWSVDSAETVGLDPLIVRRADDLANIPGSLRYALGAASNGDVVSFDAALQGQTIALTGTELVVDKSITIDASNLWDAQNGEPGVTISGSGASRVMSITANASLIGLTIADGKAEKGAGIFAATGTNVSLVDCFATGNTLEGESSYELYGGGVYSLGDLTLQNVTISSNAANATVDLQDVVVRGVGVYSAGSLTIQNSEVSSNGGYVGVSSGTFDIRGWGICAEGELTIDASSVHNNSGARFYSASSREEETCLCVGGGVYASGTTVSIVNSSVENNNAGFGGGLYLDSPAATIKNSWVSGNSTTWHVNGPYASVVRGGGIYNANALTLNNVELNDNTASATASSSLALAYGGALFSAVSVEINDSSINGNVATASGQNGAEASGGAVFTDAGSTVSVKESEFSNNSAGRYGGAVRLVSTDAVIEDSVFNGNSSGNTGGAVDADRGSVTIIGSVFNDNVADAFGGAVQLYKVGVITIADSSFTGNTVLHNNGGAVYVNSGTFNFDNLSFVGNGGDSVVYGGAVTFYAAIGTITDSTFENNVASYAGGALATQGGASVELDNVTATGNRCASYGGAFDFNTWDVDGTYAIISNSRIENNSAGTGGAITTGGAIELTIADSVFENNVAGGNGGALYLSEGALLTIEGGSFKANSADNYGGAIRAKSTAITVDGVAFVNNTAGNEGGAIKTDDCSITIVRSEFSDNVSNGTGGAAQLWNASTVVINDSSFARNKSLSNNGGAIFASCPGGNVAIYDSDFIGNRGQSGGGISVSSTTTATIVDTSFVNNSAVDDGGALLSWGQATISLEGGSFNGNQAGRYGGAMRLDDVAMTINDVVFSGNTANDQGGAIKTDAGTLAISRSDFTDNVAASYGGAAQIWLPTTVSIIDTNFTRNTVLNSNGGAVYLNGGTVSFERDSFVDNGDDTTVVGGAVYFQTTTGTVQTCSFVGNSALWYGGAACINDSSVEVVSSTFTGNTVNGDGGALQIENNTTLTVDRCEFVDNVANTAGGSFYLQQNTNVAFANSVIAGNNATSGGGVFSLGNATFTNCTIVNNEATTNGGGLYAGSTTTIRNSIVALNSAASGVDVYGADEAAINGYDVLSSYDAWLNASETNVVNYLYDPTRPLFVDAQGGDYRLALGSQAIDKGNDAFISFETDLAGNPRVDGERVDLGAFECDTRVYDLVVRTTEDSATSRGSLRYALANAREGDSITFLSSLNGKTIVLTSDLVIDKAVTIDGGNNEITIGGGAIIASESATISNVRLAVNALTVSEPLELVDSTLRFVGSDATLTATAAINAERLVVEGADSTWSLAQNSVFVDPTFKSKATLTDGSVLNFVGTLTSNADVVFSNASINALGGATIAGTGAVSFSGASNDAINVVGTQGMPATLTIVRGATLRGAGKITGQYLTTVVDGTFVPVGTFAIQGDFELTDGASLRYGVASLTDYPTLAISGAATLAGEVVLERLNNGFVPTSEDSFVVLQASALDVLASATFDVDSMNALAQMTEEITGDSLIFTVGWISGAKVVAVAPVDNYSSGASRTYVDVYFNQSIDASSFTAADVVVRNAQNEIVAIEAPQSLNASDSAFRVYFADDVRINGTYSIVIGPDVRNANGVLMNQDGVEPNGEATDQFVGSFEIALPDLTVSVDDGAIPATAELGTKFEFDYGVANVGSADTVISWKNKVYLSKDVELSSDDYLLTTTDSDRLDSGANVALTAKSILPLDNSMWTTGDYYFIVVANADSDVFETSEANNVFVSDPIFLTYPSRADIQISSLTAPSTATSGELVELVWDEVNAGARRAAETRLDAIYISSDGSLDNATLLKTVRRSDVLEPGESTRRRETVAIPSTDWFGSVYFVVVADFEDVVPEEDEMNNVAWTSGATALTQKLNISFSQSTLDEGTSNVRGVVSRTGDLSQPLVVSISSGDATELTVVDSVTIPAGQASAPFFYSAVRDSEYDEDAWVELAFSADGFATRYGTIKVVNTDVPKLSLFASKLSMNEGEEISLTITRSYVADNPITVRLSSSSSSQLSFPTSVEIPANESSVTITVAAVDDDRPENESEVTITATSPTFTAAMRTITVVDDDEPTISIALDSETVLEGVGGNAFVGTVTRAQAASSALRVRLTSSDPSKLGVPNEITIPAGRTSATFYGASYDNGTVDGEVVVTITATGVLEDCGCSMSPESTGTASTEITVLDDDGATLSVRLSRALLSQGEEDAATLTVTRNTSTDEDIVVVLSSSDPILTLPATLVIPACNDSSSVSISTNWGEEFALETWVTIMASAEGFTRGMAKALVSEAYLPDLRPANVEAVQDETDLNSFTVSYLVVNEGRVETLRSWKEQVWISTKPTLDDEARLVATFERTDVLSSDEGINSISRSFACSPDDMGDSVYWFVVVDSEDSIMELIETNNVAVSGEQSYTPPYAAVVQTDVDMADPSNPVPFYGYAYNVNTGARLGGVDVTIDIKNEPFVRTITVTTEPDGSFETNWTPLSTEVGSYTIGARRPGKTTSPVQDRFSLMRLSPDVTRGSFNISVGQTASGTFVVYNKTKEPITDFGTRLEGLADNLHLDVRTSSTIIPAGGSAVVTIAATALSYDSASSKATLYLTSAETRDEAIALNFNVYPSYAVLTTDKPTISTSMIVGKQKVVEFEICNESGVETGPITVDLPADFTWLSCVNGTTLESLAPGEARKVQLLLNPRADLPLQMYQGRFVLNYGNSGLGVDFHFRAATEVFADLTVKATDEWTYYTEDGPALVGATVRVVDSLTKQIVSNGTTGDDGTWSVVGLPEGYYDVYVDAEKHNNYRATIYLDSDQTCEAFLQMQTVRYEWVVTPTTIEDRYDITIETTYETNVPAPVITVSPALVDISDMEVGERRQVDFTFKNRGLIAVYDFAPSYGSRYVFDDYVVMSLVDKIDVLSAKSTCVIPVVIERLASSPTPEESGSRLDEATISVASSGTNGKKYNVAMNEASFGEKTVSVARDASKAIANGEIREYTPLVTNESTAYEAHNYLVEGNYNCNGEKKAGTGVPLITKKTVDSGAGSGFMGIGGPEGLGGGVSGVGGSSYSVSVTNACPIDLSIPAVIPGENSDPNDNNDYDEDEHYYEDDPSSNNYVTPNPSQEDEPCHECGSTFGASIGLKLALKGRAKDVLNRLIKAYSFLTIKTFDMDVSFSVNSGLCCDCDGGYGFHGEASLSGTVTASVLVGIDEDLAPFTDSNGIVSAHISGGIEVALACSVSVSYKKECGKEGEWCSTGSFHFIPALICEVSGSIARVPIVGDLTVYGEASLNLDCYGFAGFCTSTGWVFDASVTPSLKIDYGYKLGDDSFHASKEWIFPTQKSTIRTTSMNQSFSVIDRGNDWDEDSSDYYVISEEYLFGDFNFPEDSEYPDMDYEIYNNYTTAEEAAEVLGYSTRIDLENDLGYSLNDVLSVDDYGRCYDVIYQKYHSSNKGVCATVKLELKQQAVLTRDAFDAKLVLENGTSDAISNVAVDIIIYDEWGNNVTDMFGVYPPTTENFYNAAADNLGDLEATSEGIASWIFVPSTNCAKNGPQRYSVGGILRYVAGGREVAMTMASASIVVYPQPELELDYFWQRDVIGDDPWTDEIEASEPFELAVLVQNKGAGDARNLRVVSAQPEIVENEKGLLVDFTIVGSKLNGKEASNSLTVDFGDIPAGGSAVGQWFMEAPLQGHFIDYNATFQHINGFDDLQFSLVKNVAIHELIHTVKDDSLDAEDDLPDFLVNDRETLVDVYDLPDALYLSSGEVESVATTTNYSISGALGRDVLTVDLTVAAADAGWNYVWVHDQDPGADDYELYRAVRSDGKELDPANFWQTNRAFVDGTNARNENTLHLLDKFDAASDVYTYTLYYRPSDQTGPEIASIEELPSSIRVAPLESVNVVFSEPIDASTFTTSNLTLTRNGGRNLVDNLVSIRQISDVVYRISGFSSATSEDGAYKLSVSTLGVTDYWGNLAETNSSILEWTNAAESPVVQSVDQPAAPGQNAVDALTIVFSQPVDASTFTLDDMILTRGSGENLMIAESGATLIATNATEWILSGLTTLTSEDGEYVFSVDATGVRGTNGKRGVGVQTVSWIKDSVGPSNAVWSGIDRQIVNYGYDALYLGFDERIDFDSLSRADLTLTRDGAVVPLDSRLAMGVLPESLKTTDSVEEWRLVGLRGFASEDGNYVLTIDLSGVWDLAGNFGSGTVSVAWTVDSTAPTIEYSFTKLLSTSEIELVGVATEENVSVTVYDSNDLSEYFIDGFSNNDVAIRFSIPQEGAHELLVRVCDAAGNKTETSLNARIDRTSPFVVGRSVSKNVLRVKFSEETNIGDLVADGAIAQVVALYDDATGATIDLSAALFSYDATTKTLAIDLNDVDVLNQSSAQSPLNTGGSDLNVASIRTSAVDNSADRSTIPLTLRIDGLRVRDAVGNLLVGSDVNAKTSLRFTYGSVVASANAYSVPSLVDWNGDGVLDMIVGEKSADGLGRVKVLVNNGTNANPIYADASYATYRNVDGENVELIVPAQGCQGAAPRAVDVDGDGALDLFVGLHDGSILFYRGEGTGLNWTLTASEFVSYGQDGAKSQLSVGSRAVFEVCDWNNDGRYDLLVGSSAGKIYLLVDSASRGLFDFRTMTALTNVDGTGEITLSSGRTAPTLVDVNGDGLFDIVTGDNVGAFYVYRNVGTRTNPKFGSETRLTDMTGDLSLPNDAKRSRPFACDYDEDGNVDLLVGSSDGNVYFYRGVKSTSFNTNGEPGDEFVCSFDWTYEGRTLVVNTSDDFINDDEFLSLREAIANVRDKDIITFDSTLKGATITLAAGQLEIGKSITIDASDIWDEENDKPGVTINGNNLSRVFYVAGENVKFIGLTIANGFALDSSTKYGGGVCNTGGLTITNVDFSGNKARLGGAIYNRGTLSVTGTDDRSCAFANNEAIETFVDGACKYGSGGGLYNSAGNATLVNVSFSGNEAYKYGGAISNFATLCATDIEADSNVAGAGGALQNAGIAEIVGFIATSNRALTRDFALTGSDFGGNGGAIFQSNNASGKNGEISTLSLSGLTLENNYAQNAGGAVDLLSGTVTFNGSNKFYSNSADVIGGALIVVADVAFNNATFAFEAEVELGDETAPQKNYAPFGATVAATYETDALKEGFFKTVDLNSLTDGAPYRLFDTFVRAETIADATGNPALDFDFFANTSAETVNSVTVLRVDNGNPITVVKGTPGEGEVNVVTLDELGVTDWNSGDSIDVYYYVNGASDYKFKLTLTKESNGAMMIQRIDMAGRGSLGVVGLNFRTFGSEPISTWALDWGDESEPSQYEGLGFLWNAYHLYKDEGVEHTLKLTVAYANGNEDQFTLTCVSPQKNSGATLDEVDWFADFFADEDWVEELFLQ